MKRKRILSVVLATLLGVSTVAFAGFNKDNAEKILKNENTGIESPDVDIGATNSVGKYISNLAMQDEEAKAQALDEYSGNFLIDEITFYPENGVLLVKSTQAAGCNLKISIADEETNVCVLNTDQSIASGSSIITEVRLDITSLPEYYYLTADLTDFTGNLLCPTYYCNDYTREMQEIYAANIYDFDADRVVNFDDNDSTNFIVLNESTVIAESSETSNTLVSADYDNNVYTFENYDEIIGALKEDDYFFIYTGETDAIAINVENIEFDENTAIITASDDDIDDMFDFMKFESTADTLDAEIDMSTADDSVDFAGVVFDDENQQIDSNTMYMSSFMYASAIRVMSDDISAEVGGAKLSFPVEYKDKETDPNFVIKGSVDIGFKLKFNFYKKFSYVNLSVKLSMPLSVGVSAEVKNGKFLNPSIPLATIDIPTGIIGCYLKIQPKFVVELEAKFEVRYSIEPSLKISYDSDTDKSPKFTSSYGDEASEFTFDLEGKAFVGIDFDPTLVILHEKLASLSASAKAGIEMKGKLETKLTGDGELTSNVFISTDTSGNTAHACGTCIDGDINFIIEGSLKLKVLLIGELKATLVKVTIPLGDWYYSSDLGFGWGTCPNIAYKLAFNVSDSSGKSISGAKIHVDSIELTTGSGGNAYCYCKEGTYDYQVSYGDYSDCYGDATIYNKAKTINLQINADGAIEVKSAKDTSVTVPSPTIRDSIPVPEDEPDPVVEKVTVVESGRLGEDIYYMIYADGFMFVYGSGEMDDYGYHYENASLVTEVSVENTDGSKGITKIGAYSFAGLESMTKIELPDTITSIGDYAFEGCSSIKNIDIPSKVTLIGDYAFSGCISLSSLEIPSSVKSLGEFSFNNCISITQITIPGTVQSVGNYLFESCTGLKTVVISDGVGNIGNWIFDNCTSLSSITLPYAGHSAANVAANIEESLSTTMFCYYVPEGTYDVNSWGVPNSLKSVTITGGNCVPTRAFAGMQNLTSIQLPNSVLTIHNNAFEDCIGLSKIDFLPTSVVTIEEEAFARCTGITTATIPNKVTSLGRKAFADCSKLKTVTLSNTLSSINEYTFENCISLTGVSIPSSVKTLGEFAFNNCISITQITIPGTVQSVGSYLFESCTGLKTVVISDGVGNIGNWIFDNCTSLSSITLPYAGHSAANVAANIEESISTTMFCYYVPEGTYDVNSWGVPNSLKSITITGGNCIPTRAFVGLQSVNTIKLPSTVTVIQNNAFEDCSGLYKIDFIPSSVKVIGTEAFVRCSNVITATIPSGVVTIGERAFADCTSLACISLSDTITTLGNSVFSNCSLLSGISIPASVTAIGDAGFENCVSLRKVTIPGNVKTIGANLFNNCTGLTEVNIEDGVGGIGNWIFEGCTSLEKLTLPYAGQSEASVAANTENPLAHSLFCYYVPDGTYDVNGWGVPYTLTSITITGGSCIPSYAFYGLSSLKEIKIYGEASVIHNNAFEYCSGLESFTVPEGVDFIEKDSFKNCTGLKELKLYNPEVSIYDNSDTIPNITTIYGYNNSTAQDYTDSYSKKFISLGDYLTSATLIGDCNLDGKVDIEDAKMLQDYLLARTTFTRHSWLNADMNQDGSVDVFDMVFIRRKLIYS